MTNIQEQLKSAVAEIESTSREIDRQLPSSAMEERRMGHDKIFLLSIKVKALTALAELAAKEQQLRPQDVNPAVAQAQLTPFRQNLYTVTFMPIGSHLVPTRPFLNITAEGVTKLLDEYGRYATAVINYSKKS